MAHLLLVHGSNHGAWCWRDVAPDVTGRGHDVSTVDLPSVSQDPSTLSNVSLDDDAGAILAAISEPSILVGHSAAGFAITRAAERAPDMVAALVYLCAYVPHGGHTVSDLARAAPGHPLNGSLDVNRTHRAYRFRDIALRENLYADCPAETLAFARPRLGWQAINAQTAPGPRPPDRIPAHYIICLNDRAIPPEQQRDMAKTIPDATRHELDTGHSPFFAAPKLLCDLLHGIVVTLPRGGPRP